MPRDLNKSGEKLATLKDMAAMYAQTITIEEFEEHCIGIQNKLIKSYSLNKTVASLVVDRFVSGLSLKELAKQTGMSTLTIKSVLDYAVKQLKDKGVSFGQQGT